jgi:hypothetical protein
VAKYSIQEKTFLLQGQEVGAVPARSRCICGLGAFAAFPAEMSGAAAPSMIPSQPPGAGAGYQSNSNFYLYLFQSQCHPKLLSKISLSHRTKAGTLVYFLPLADAFIFDNWEVVIELDG